MKKNKIERQIIAYVWVYALVVAGILLAVSKWSFVLPLSFILGTVVSLLCFTLTIKTVDRIIRNENLSAKSEYIKNYLMKMLVYAAVLACAGYSTYNHGEQTMYINIYATAGGFFSVKVMIYIKSFIIDKIRNSPEDEATIETKIIDNQKEDEKNESDH